MLGWIIFIVTWFVCFVFSYRVFYITDKNKSYVDDASDRACRFGFSSLHLISVFISIWGFIEEADCKFEIKADGFIGKLLKKLEKK